MAILVVDRLEVVDVDHHQRNAVGLAAGEQAAQMAHQVALVVEAGQRVGQRHFQRGAEIGPQPVLIELAADLVARPRPQFVDVDRAHQPIVGAEIEAAQDTVALVGLGDQQQRNVVGDVGGADSRRQPQRVIGGHRQAKHDQIERNGRRQRHRFRFAGGTARNDPLA